jgi:integrase
MGRKSITGGVMPVGPCGIQFDFSINRRRFRPTLPWTPSETNLRRARELLTRVKAQIAAGTFRFTDEFPDYRGLRTLPHSVQPRLCGEVLDAFLRHQAARVARGDLAPVTLSSHRKILDHVWRPHLGGLPLLGVTYSMLVKIADSYPWGKKTYNNAISALRRAFSFGYLDHPERRDPAAALKCARIGKKDRPSIDPFTIRDAETFIAALHRDWGEAYSNYEELRFFTGLRPSEEIALVVTDYDQTHGMLSITKARVNGVDKDVTKTGEDRRITLCPRARAILERQLRLRRRAIRSGLVQHDHLFFTEAGHPIKHLGYCYWRWQRTLKRLPIRYRKPYMARHTSVSWNLMLGRNPLLVGKEHGHRPTTMLTVYAAWAEGAAESDSQAILEARERTRRPRVRQISINPPADVPSKGTPIPRTTVTTTRTSQETRVTARLPSAGRFGSGFVSGRAASDPNYLNSRENFGGKGGTRTLDPGIMSAVP